MMVARSEAAAAERVHAGEDHQPRDPVPYVKVLLTGPMIARIRIIRAI